MSNRIPRRQSRGIFKHKKGNTPHKHYDDKEKIIQKRNKVMAYLMNCKICDIETLNTNICGDCAQRIAGLVTNGQVYNKEDVKKFVENKRMKAIQVELDKQMSKCPTCGK